MKLYDRIREVCKSTNVTIAELEKKLGFARSSLCKWNANTPSVEKVKLVADCLGVTVDSLISDISSNHIKQT